MSDNPLDTNVRPVIGRTYSSPAPVLPAILAVVRRDGAFLLVRRANPPDAGLWGFPGGKIAFGETITEAALRELREETAIIATAAAILPPIDALDRSPSGSIRHHFILIPVLCEFASGSVTAGDDALEARFVAFQDIEAGKLPMSAGVAELAHRARVSENETF